MAALNAFCERFRQETLRIQMALEKSAHDRHSEALKSLNCAVGDVHSGDQVMVNYQFDITYWGGVVDKLRAVLELCNDEEIVISEFHEELKHGECVIEHVALALRDLKSTLERRSEPPSLTSV